MLNMDIKSLPKHYDELQQKLNVSVYVFFWLITDYLWEIGIWETMLNEKNAYLNDANRYVVVKGGVYIYTEDTLTGDGIYFYRILGCQIPLDMLNMMRSKLLLLDWYVK